MSSSNLRSEVPVWFWVVAVLSLAWNVFGVIQFLDSVRSTQESLIAMGMTVEQAQTMLSYPLWMTIAFAVGTFGGLIGCFLLLLRKKLATQVFIASLLGYIVLFIGDITEGVFAALGISQVIILTTVVIIAALLVWLAKKFEGRGALN